MLVYHACRRQTQQKLFVPLSGKYMDAQCLVCPCGNSASNQHALRFPGSCPSFPRTGTAVDSNLLARCSLRTCISRKARNGWVLSKDCRNTRADCQASRLTVGRRSYYYYTAEQRRSVDRAAALVRNIRIVKPQPVPLIARLLRHLFSDQVCKAVSDALQCCVHWDTTPQHFRKFVCCSYPLRAQRTQPSHGHESHGMLRSSL